jgi:hypothetical protein
MAKPTPQEEFDAYWDRAWNDVLALLAGVSDEAIAWATAAAAIATSLQAGHAMAHYLGRLHAGDTEPFGDADNAAGAAAWTKYLPNWGNLTADVHTGRYGAPGEDFNAAALGNRLKLYMDGWQPTAAAAWLAAQPEGDLYDWFLDSGAKHCADCPAFADGGPYTADTLPGMPGDGCSACMSGCRCQLVNRTTGEMSLTIGGSKS